MLTTLAKFSNICASNCFANHRQLVQPQGRACVGLDKLVSRNFVENAAESGAAGSEEAHNEGKEPDVYPLSNQVKHFLTEYYSWAGLTTENLEIARSHFPLKFVRRDIPLTGLFGLFAFIPKAVLEWTSDPFVKTLIETDHSKEEFHRGAETAFITVHELLKDKDWQGLTDLVAPQLLHIIRKEYEQFSSLGLTYTCLPTTDVKASRARFFTLTKAELNSEGRIEDEEAESEPEVGPHNAQATGSATTAIDPAMLNPVGFSKQWEDYMKSTKQFLAGRYQAANVDIHCTLTSEVIDSNGVVLLQVINATTRIWSFARGPLPQQLPRRELPLNWKFISERPA